MTFPGLIRANNLSDVADKEKAWDNLGLNIIYTFTPIPSSFDSNASAYIAQVEETDRSELGEEAREAINAFVVGCKNDGIWPAIKASCILAGARTLAGALVPLVGVAPTNVGPFVVGDYNRKTGLIGDGNTKYLNSNATTGAGYWSQNSNHVAVCVSSAATTVNGLYAGSSITVDLGKAGTTCQFTNYNLSSDIVAGQGSATGFIGISRSAIGNFVGRVALSNTIFTRTSTSNTQQSMFLYGRNESTRILANARLSFYSIGESLDLALLDTRVAALLNNFATIFP